jgi:hypothetical protein
VSLKFYRNGKESAPSGFENLSDADGRTWDIDAHENGFRYPLARDATAREAMLIEAIVGLLLDEPDSKPEACSTLWSLGCLPPPCLDQQAAS